MSDINTQSRIVKIRNELRALKTVSELSYGALVFPESTPQAVWNGTVTKLYSETPDAVFEAVFTRTDGIDSTPLVDFSFNYTAPTEADYIRSIGGTVSMNDEGAANAYAVDARITDTTDNSVKYTITFNSGIGGMMSSYNLSLDVMAISPVQGNLVLTRVS